MYEKQSHLNRAYYGPSVYAPESYQRLSRRGDGGCLFSLIFKFILTALTIVGIAVLLFWLIVRPNVVKFHVADASLTEFNYTANNNTLHYNLAVEITVRNPNSRIGVFYNDIEAKALYQNARFDTYSFGRFYQEQKTTKVLKHVYKGQHVVALGAEQRDVLNKEKRLGVYGIDVKMYLKVRFKLGMYRSMTMKPKVRCDLHVPFKSDGGGYNFEVTKCHWNF